MLRGKVWWPKINQQVENAIRTCIPCLRVKGETTPELLKTNEMHKPREKVHIDICGPFPSGDNILGIIDSATRWRDIHIIKSTSSQTVSGCL